MEGGREGGREKLKQSHMVTGHTYSPVNGSRILATSSIFPPAGFLPFSSTRSRVARTSLLLSSLSMEKRAWPVREGGMQGKGGRGESGRGGGGTGLQCW